MKIKIDGYTVEVDTTALAQAIANASQAYADWRSFTGKAERIAKDLPRILKIERTLF